MDYKLLLLIEASIVGVVIAIVGTLLTFLVVLSTGKSTKFIWNFTMFAVLFLTGALSHILFEFTGFNNYYCKMFNKTRK